MAEPAVGVPVYDPATGQLTHQTPEEAAPQLRTGRVRTPGGEPVSIVRGNEVREIDPSKLAEAESYGWALVDSTGVRAARIRDEESGLVGSARGSAEALASGLTFGLSDLAAAKLGADPERMRARQEGLGDVGGALRLAGEVLPIALSGGTAAGVRGAAGKTIARLGVAPRAVEAAGLAVETGAERLLGEGLGGRALGAFGRGVVEGTASGLGQEIHESVLGDRELTTERMLSSGAMAGLFGGGASAAFPLTGALLRRGSKLETEAATDILAKATRSDPTNVRPVAEMLGAAVQGKPLSPTRQILGEMASGPEGRKLVNEVAHDLDGVTQRSAGVAKQATVDFAERMRSVVQKTEADRTENMRRLFGEADDEIVPGRVLGEMESLMQRLDNDGYRLIDEYGPGEISKRHLDTMRGELQRAWDDIVEKGSSAADAHTRLLGVKRRARELARDVGRMDSRAQQTNQVLRNIERQIGDALGAPEFGKAAEAWQEMSKADALALQSADELFKADRITGARKGKNLLGRVLNGEATDAEILTFTKRVGNPRYADQAAAADDYFQRQIQAAEIRAKHSANAGLADDVAQLKKGYEDFQRTMKQQAKVADIADAFRTAGRGSLPGVLSIFGPSGATVAGALLGGTPGAVIGGALNAAARPGSTLRTLAAVGHLADKAGIDVDKIVKSALSVDPASAAKAVAGAAVRGTRRAAATAGRVASRGRGVVSRGAAMGAVSKRNERQQERLRRADELSDPDTLTRELAQQMYALADAAPGIAGVAAEKIGLAAAFLKTKLPPETVDPLTGAKVSADEATRQSFDRYYEAVTDPVATLRRLEDGSFSSEHAEALREVWPAMYADIQMKVLEGMQERADKGESIPYQRRASLGVLLGLPTDVSLTPEFLAAMSGQHAQGRAVEDQQAQAQQSGRRTRKTSFDSPSDYQTPLGRIGRDNT